MINFKSSTSKYLVLALAIIFIPNVLTGYFNYRSQKDFHEELDMNREMCYEQAAQHNFPETICREIISNVRDTQSVLKTESISLLILTGIIYGLASGTLGLKEQIDELKEKSNA